MTLPEVYLVAQLETMFPSAQVAPAGITVDHATGDPIPPYVLYRRTSEKVERTLDNLPSVMIVEFEVSIGAMFFDAVAMSLTDNWYSNGWYFAVNGQYMDTEAYNYTVIIEAATAL